VGAIDSYEARISAELDAYATVEQVHDLPASHDYWVAGYVAPLFVEVGVGGLDDLFEEAVVEQCARRAPDRARLVSLGAGNGEYELPFAARLAARGVENLELLLLELNDAMLERALETASELGLSGRVTIEQTDLNTWTAEAPADIYLAIHSLHHVVALEHLYDQVAATLDPAGVVLVNDMIGRNGHVRWPEAGEILAGIWRNLPERYRFNHYVNRTDPEYPDVDCAANGGFEGVRAQDVLPLLLARFHPELYVTFGNLVDPFIDRIYGPNLDLGNPDDASFLDTVARLDDAAIDLGVVTPTHLIGSFRASPVTCRYPRMRSPQRTARRGRPSDVQPRSEVTQAQPIDSEVITLQQQLHAAEARYSALRDRKAVRGALAFADRVGAVRRRWPR
jgi:SAM-dependent methyltransferase